VAIRGQSGGKAPRGTRRRYLSDDAISPIPDVLLQYAALSALANSRIDDEPGRRGSWAIDRHLKRNLKTYHKAFMPSRQSTFFPSA
jgi:hypothetical protein